MDRLHCLVENADNYLSIGPLGSQLALDVLKSWLLQYSRTLTDEQWNIVDQAFTRYNHYCILKTCFILCINFAKLTCPIFAIASGTIDLKCHVPAPQRPHKISKKWSPSYCPILTIALNFNDDQTRIIHQRSLLGEFMRPLLSRNVALENNGARRRPRSLKSSIHLENWKYAAS